MYALCLKRTLLFCCWVPRFCHWILRAPFRFWMLSFMAYVVCKYHLPLFPHTLACSSLLPFFSLLFCSPYLLPPGFHSASQDGLRPVILLPQSPECWAYRHVLPCSVSFSTASLVLRSSFPDCLLLVRMVWVSCLGKHCLT